MTSSSHLGELVPDALIEREYLKSSLRGKKFTIIFDGTSHLGSLNAWVVRYVEDSGSIGHKALALKHCDKPLDTSDLCAMFNFVVKEAGLDPGIVITLSCS